MFGASGQLDLQQSENANVKGGTDDLEEKKYDENTLHLR